MTRRQKRRHGRRAPVGCCTDEGIFCGPSFLAGRCAYGTAPRRTCREKILVFGSEHALHGRAERS